MKRFKRLSVVIIALMIFLPLINSCKKGENDPTLSFKSRDGRITEKWKLNKIEGTIVTSVTSLVQTTRTQNITYDGNTYTEASTTTGFPTETKTGTGTFEMNIEKNGLMSTVESYTPTVSSFLQTIKENNTWFWANNDKKKTTIVLNAGGENLFKSGTYTINRLAGKELILKLKYDYNNTIDNTINSGSRDFTYTFEKK